jgi:hypothetical protein
MDINKQEQGRKNRQAGARFERKVRDFFEREGWIVAKNPLNVDLLKHKLIPAKSNRFMMRTMGFPDFIIFRIAEYPLKYCLNFVECKTNGRLTKLEKQKLDFLVRQGHNCLVASKGEGYKIKIEQFEGYEDKTRSVAAASPGT